jgi:hypothetical protein
VRTHEGARAGQGRWGLGKGKVGLGLGWAGLYGVLQHAAVAQGTRDVAHSLVEATQHPCRHDTAISGTGKDAALVVVDGGVVRVDVRLRDLGWGVHRLA